MKDQTVGFYANKGLIVPSVSNPKGRGTTRLYSKTNLLEFLLLKELGKHGLMHERIENIISKLKQEAFFKEYGEEPSSKDIQSFVKHRGKNQAWGSILLNPDLFQNNRLYLFLFDAFSENYKEDLMPLVRP